MMLHASTGKEQRGWLLKKIPTKKKRSHLFNFRAKVYLYGRGVALMISLNKANLRMSEDGSLTMKATETLCIVCLPPTEHIS